MADPSQGTAPPGAPPAGGGPPALPPNFYDAKPFANYSSTILGVSITLLSCCWIAIVFRLWIRFRVTKNPGLDDLFVVLALLAVTTGSVSLCVATHYGMGQHIYLIKPENLTTFLLCHYLDAASYNTSTAFIKLSLLFQYLRVFERGTYTYRFTQLLLVIVSIWAFIFIFTAWISCFPHPSAFWKMTGKGCYGGYSSNISTVIQWIEAHAGSNLFLDFSVLTLAFRLVFLEEAQATRLGMIVLLCMGIGSCGFATWRLAQILVSKAGIGDDLSWNLPGPTLLSLCEIYIACLCASIPFFWPMISKQLGKIFVSYEFNVSTESRYDDDVELAPTASRRSDARSEGGKEDSRSLKSKFGSQHVSEGKPYYRDDFVQQQVDPFGEEFRTEAAVSTAGKKKSGFVRFGNPQ